MRDSGEIADNTYRASVEINKAKYKNNLSKYKR